MKHEREETHVNGLTTEEDTQEYMARRRLKPEGNGVS